MFSAIVGLVLGTILWFITGLPTLEFKDSLFVIATGVLTIFASALYSRVMSQEEATKVIFMLQLTPLIVLLLSFIFLREKIDFKVLLGFALILFSVITASFKKSTKFNFKISKVLFLMLAADFLWGSSSVLFKFVSESNNFVKMVSYESWGWAIGGIILYSLFPTVRKAFFATLVGLRKSALAVVFGNELVYVISKLIGFWAISLGSVSLVSALNGTNVFFGVLYGWILTLIAPKVFKEAVTSKDLLVKFALAGVVVVGIFLIS